MRAVPHLCGCYPGICLTTEENDVSCARECCVLYTTWRHRVVNNIHIFIFMAATIYCQHFIFNAVYVHWMCWFCTPLYYVTLRMAIYRRNM
jgi:hypothetical protein